ncbi:Unknown protein [Striga hermonthica]|uniref:GRF-type domain-containing protein n=1 Tax=Striga hermonthica TaxID=68872 RepID=A0A9N7NRZ0_STRHE|nr:Unknown protein [Striga hermonthica]
MSDISTDYPYCNCGKRAEIRTSWKTPNCGRRFFSCLYWNAGGCNFFGWADPPLCVRAQQIIHGLLRRLNEMEESRKRDETEKTEVLKFEEEIKKLKKQLIEFEEIKKLKKQLTEFEEENKKLKAAMLKFKKESTRKTRILRIIVAFLIMLIFMCFCGSQTVNE